MRIRALIFIVGFCLFLPEVANAWIGMPTPRLHVDGRYLKDPHGNIVNLHGFAQTYSPWFNERGTVWNNHDVDGCLEYNQGLIDDILDAGWMMSFVRLHMDPYWSDAPGCSPDAHELPNCFDEERFEKYLDEVFIPMAEYAISKGLYVIMRPPGVCPEVIGVEDDYNYAEYLMTVWDIVSKHPKINSSDEIMFELANEPVNIRLEDGSVGSNTQAHFDVLKEIFQPVVDRIRENGFHNVLWIPGSGYQSHYKGFAVNPIEGENIGYAVHIYPGWFGSADGYDVFKREWDENVKPVADFAPIAITEMDWAPEEYNASWGKGITGTAGGEGFGANFKKIMDETGNVSWLLFTEPHRLAQFTGEPPAEGEPYTFLNDPEACPWPIYHWYQDYAELFNPRPDFEKRSHSDNSDGTYTNPVIHADFPNPDVIRVNDIYYMVTSTMNVFPGATLLKSRDLVNWEYCNNPLEIIESSDAYNLQDGQNRYGEGQVNSSLRYHDGKFYIIFTTPNDGSFLLSATNPKGQWNIKQLSGSYFNPGLLFDDDGKIYLVHGVDEVVITEFDENFESIGDDYTIMEISHQGLNGIYKINDYYYISANYSGSAIFRSSDIFGLYQANFILDENIRLGSLVETQTGEWWTIYSSDESVFGKLPNLQPVTWVDNWPEIAFEVKGDATYSKPDVGRDYPLSVLPTTDNFRNYRILPQWGWNHNPDDSKWSLFDRPGFLRLQTVNAVDNLLEARNTLTQRIFGYHSDNIDSYGTIKMHIDSMKEGDIAGLAVLQDPYAYIGVTMEGGEKKLIMSNDGDVQIGNAINDSVIYLRAVANYGTSKTNFYYSIDNENYDQFGTEMNMGYEESILIGNRFGIFNFAKLETGGFVDINWFTTEEIFTQDMFYDDNFVKYSEDQLTLDSLYIDTDEIQMLTGNNKTLVINALFKDGSIENVNRSVSFENSNPDVAQIVNGQVLTQEEGTTTITATYDGKLGGYYTIEFNISVMTFPLTNELLNPSIWDDGTFDEETGELITGQWGFGGWQYGNGLDLSGYKYLVVELKEPTLSNASFRLFDQPSYWSDAFSKDVGSETQIIVNLSNMRKDVNDQTVLADPSNIYIVGFWSHGTHPITIEDVFLSNSDEYYVPVDDDDDTPGDNDDDDDDDTPSSIQDISGEEMISDDDIVDVYSLTGTMLRSNVKRKNATMGLSPGVYIVGKPVIGYQKIFVGRYE